MLKKLWIKFEDTHGMFTIWNKLSNSNLNETVHTFTEVNSGTIVSNAVGNRWVRLKRSDISLMVRQEITDIVYIVDLDNISGYKDKLLDLETLLKVKDEVVLPLGKYNINVWFIPVVYAAESILLLQYIREYTETVEGLVSVYNTTDLHLKLLRLLSGCDTNKEVKRVVSYVDYGRFLEGLGYKRTVEHLLCYDWIKNNCEFRLDYLIDVEQFIELLNSIGVYYNSKKVNTVLDLLGREVDLTKAIDYFRINVNSCEQYILSNGPRITQDTPTRTASGILDSIK